MVDKALSKGLDDPNHIPFKCFHYPIHQDKLIPGEEWFYGAFKNSSLGRCVMCRAIGYRYAWTSKYIEATAEVPRNQNLHDIEAWQKKFLDFDAFKEGVMKAEELYYKMHGPLDENGIYNYRPDNDYNYTPTTEKGPWIFAISETSSGEVFHLAVAKMLLPTQITIPVEAKYKKQDADMAGTWKKSYDLLRFYGLAKNPKTSGATEKPLHVVTEIVADTFRQNYEQQGKLFEMIRNTFERSHESDSSLSSLGSYYLNCFLRSTEQNGGQLPPPGEKESVALIFVRQSAKDDRNMSLENIRQCLLAIKQANETAPESKQTMRKFRHLILFGDVMELEDKRVTACREFCKSEGWACTIITQPWGGKADLDSKIRRFWAEYREEGHIFKPGWEGVPFQVKNLSLFLALRKQYGNNLCWIGFRSGFLDGAAFLGTPTFYIDSHVPLDVKNEPEQWLWKISDHSDRMVNASNKINTFIRLDIPKTPDWVLKVNDRNRLGAALYTYMLWGQNEPLWTVKTAILKSKKDAPNATSLAEHLVKEAMTRAPQK